MVTPIRPGQPPQEPPEVQQLATALKGQLTKFSEEMHLIMNSPHLADSGPALETIAKVIQGLHTTAQQASQLET